MVVEEVFTVLADFEAQEPVFLAAALELLGVIGPNERSHMRMSVIKQIMCERSLYSIHINCLCALLQLGIEGLRMLVDLATKDYNGLQPFILCNLL